MRWPNLPVVFVTEAHALRVVAVIQGSRPLPMPVAMDLLLHQLAEFVEEDHEE